MPLSRPRAWPTATKGGRFRTKVAPASLPIVLSYTNWVSADQGRPEPRFSPLPPVLFPAGRPLRGRAASQQHVSSRPTCVRPDGPTVSRHRFAWLSPGRVCQGPRLWTSATDSLRHRRRSTRPLVCRQPIVRGPNCWRSDRDRAGWHPLPTPPPRWARGGPCRGHPLGYGRRCAA